MSGQLKYGSRFITKKRYANIIRIKNLNKKTTGIENHAKKNDVERKSEEKWNGRRFVDIVELGKNLICSRCSNVLSLKDITNEEILAANSIFTIKCVNCDNENKVHTSKKQEVITSKDDISKKAKYSDNTTMLILGKFFRL